MELHSDSEFRISAELMLAVGDVLDKWEPGIREVRIKDIQVARLS